MRKKSENFLYFNPNPTVKYKKNGESFTWHKGDCVIRAFACATDLSWSESFAMLCKIGAETYNMPNSRDVLDIALEQFGFKKKSMTRNRLTVSELAKKTVGKICVFNIRRHEVCAKDGCFFDTWDCGDYCVYNYWEKEI